jgi:putative transposase
MSTAPAYMRLAGDPAGAEQLPTASAPRWLPLAEAQRRSGYNPGYLRRRCLEEWQGAGLARQEQVDGRGKPTWHIREDADASLARVKSPEQLPIDKSALSDAQVAEANATLVILQDWEAALAGAVKLGFKKDDATRQFLLNLEATAGRKIERATLYNWRRDYRMSGLSGLVDHRRDAGHAPDDRRTDPFYQHLERLYLTPQRRSVRFCWEMAAEACQLQGVAGPFPSYDTAKRHLAALPRQLVVRQREGAKAYNDKCAPFIKRTYGDLASNDIWCADEHCFDVMVVLGTAADGAPRIGRPEITAFEDIRSRKIVGWHIGEGAANVDTVFRAFRHGALEHGLPRQVMFDNGMHFDGKPLQGRTKLQRRRGTPPDRVIGAFGLLAVEVRHVEPYHGQSKPIERMFGTICRRFAKQWDTYCGGSPARSPRTVDGQYLARQVAAGRCPTLQQFIERFAQWLEADYHRQKHTGDAMDGDMPSVVWDRCLAAKRAIGEDMLRFALLPRYGPVKVGRNGVRWRGLDYGNTDPTLARLLGREVILAIDQDDVGRVLVLDGDGRPVCVAVQNVTLGFNATAEDVRAAQSAKKRLRKTLLEYHKARPQLAAAGDMHALVQSAAARRTREQAKQVASTPVSTAPASPHRRPP